MRWQLIFQSLTKRCFHDGFKVRNYREGDVLLSRQEGFLFSRNGSVVDQQIAFNGESVFGIGKNLEVFATVEMPDGTTVETAMDALTENMGAYLPGRDLFYEDAAAGIFDGVTDGQYLGRYASQWAELPLYGVSFGRR